MLRKSKALMVVLVLILVSVFTVMAAGVDDEGNPNDPSVNERANACYDGGSMAGKCDTEWEWEGGWFLIRFENGMISEDDFPDAYVSLLPSNIVICSVYDNQDVTGRYVVTDFVADGTLYQAISSTYDQFLTNPADFYLFYYSVSGIWIQWSGDYNGGSIIATDCDLPIPFS